ncbi:Gluconate 5-dehydrogenase [Shimia sp. SK013]|uniref:SDR family NAD(P)-dependent oxidoreductase n=1 Tax=Shimia sp. SK013 TaxID=1389006 RepID=UPI0006CD809E|nr:SDR family NAD(P)-dependent oxidoreductase [Shimia sp. SK013]KPA21054.1 Gluconate 5-dehydrogenase [Shimia sp. SK013]
MPDLPIFDLTGQNALITGSSDGLGRKAAALLAKAGAHVWINGRDRARCERAAAEIGTAGGTATALAFDVADEAGSDAAFATLANAGGVTILVNNVGMRDRRTLPEFSREDLRRMMDVDLIAPFRLSQRAAEQMAPGGYGRIVNISSIAGLIAQSGDAAYTAAKAGINGMTKALAAELGTQGINVNAVAPGYFKTAPNEAAAADPAVTAKLKSASALGRWGEPAELPPPSFFSPHSLQAMSLATSLPSMAGTPATIRRQKKTPRRSCEALLCFSIGMPP